MTGPPVERTLANRVKSEPLCRGVEIQLIARRIVYDNGISILEDIRLIERPIQIRSKEADLVQAAGEENGRAVRTGAAHVVGCRYIFGVAVNALDESREECPNCRIGDLTALKERYVERR